MESNKFCGLCNSAVEDIIHLCNSAPANNFIEDYLPHEVIGTFPLNIQFCVKCKNIQLDSFLDEELLYKNYNYVTPNSKLLSEHYQKLIDYLKKSFQDFKKFKILEIGCNDGKFLDLLKPLVQDVLGVDPASNIVSIASKRGITVINEFFNSSSAGKIKTDIDLVIARHMFAHNRNPKDILDGINALKKNNKDIHLVIENAYAIDTFLNGELDQIYHEHMYFYSATSIKNLLEANNFNLYHVEHSKVHGGSMVYFASSNSIKKSQKLLDVLSYEDKLFCDNKLFKTFKAKIAKLKADVLNEIDIALADGRKIIAYGAPAKAFTMFSFLEINSKIISHCVDITPTKIGKTFPISEVKIISEDEINNDTNKLVLVTAWNYKKEITAKASKLFKRGDILLFPLPSLSQHHVS